MSWLIIFFVLACKECNEEKGLWVITGGDNLEKASRHSKLIKHTQFNAKVGQLTVTNDIFMVLQILYL